MTEALTTKPGDKYRSLLRPDIYEALRREGHSKESAARISNAQARRGRRRKKTIEVAEKAPNYSARAGQTIAGRLVRGNDGKFSSGSGPAAPKKPKKQGSRRAARQAKKPKKAAAAPKPGKQERQAQNRTSVRDYMAANDVGLAPAGFDALMAFADGTPPTGAALDALIAAGLVEQDDNGQPRLTPDGRQAANAANRGDARGTVDAISEAGDALRGRQTRDQERQQRQQEREGRQREAQSRRQQRENERRQRQQARQEAGSGGGGGKQGGPSPQQQAQREARRKRLQQRISGLLGRGKSFTVYKDARGQWRWVGITTTAYEDRDKEIISTKALQADVARADADKLYGPLRWWHMGQPDPTHTDAPWGPGVDLGMCDFNAVCGRTLIESGTFIDPRVGAAVATKADSLAFSPGFFHPPGEPDTSGVFHIIRRFERSLAPRGKVSNRFTSLVVAKETHRMDEQKLKQLTDLLGSAELAQQVISAAQTTQKTAEAEGVRYKTEQPETITLKGVEYTLTPVEKAPPPPVAEEEAPAAEAEEMAEPPMMDEGADDALLTPAEVQAIASAVVEMIAPLLAEMSTKMDIEKKMAGYASEIKALMGGQQAQKDAERAERLEQIDARVKELEGDLPSALKGGFRASTAESTVVKAPAPLPEHQGIFSTIQELTGIAPPSPNGV